MNKKQIVDNLAIIVNPIENTSQPLQEESVPTEKEAKNKIAIPLNESEQTMISQWNEKRKMHEAPTRFRNKLNEDGKKALEICSNRGNEDEKTDLFRVSVCNATGTKSFNFGASIFLSCAEAIKKTPEDHAGKANEILDALTAFKPQDEVEGMLVSRLIALHFQSMNFLSRTLYQDQTSEGIDLNVNRSTKLMRLYNETLETLMRYRRKGEQKVIVQHVSVNEGGKAVVNGQFLSNGDGGSH